MRLAAIMVVSPSGAQQELTANGEQGLALGDPHGLLRPIVDLNLPADGTDARVIAWIPNDWALFFEWQYTEPLKPKNE